MKKVITLILSKDIKITAPIISEISMFLSINVGLENFTKISVIVDDHAKQEEPRAVAQIIRIATRIHNGEIIHSNTYVSDGDAPKGLSLGLQKYVVEAAAKNTTEYIVIVSKGSRILAPSKIFGSMAEFKIGAEMKWNQIFSVPG